MNIRPLEYHYMLSSRGYASIETPVADLVSQPFCRVCKDWGGLRSEVELLVSNGSRSDVLLASAFGTPVSRISLYSKRLAEVVCGNVPELLPRFRSASDRHGVVWQELLAPAQILYCGIRGAEVPYASRCGECGHLGAYCPDMKYVGTFFAVAEEDVSGRVLFYSVEGCRNGPPNLVATGAGVKLLRELGCVFTTVKVAVLRSADVDRMPNVKIFHEPV
jgi:hypothetical protein